MMVNEESLGFGLLVEQKEQSEDISLGSGKSHYDLLLHLMKFLCMCDQNSRRLSNQLLS